jgi:hypothetical protein
MTTKIHKYFETEVEAIAEGEAWKERVGWGYSPRYRVDFSPVTGAWVLYGERESSCD